MGKVGKVFYKRLINMLTIFIFRLEKRKELDSEMY